MPRLRGRSTSGNHPVLVLQSITPTPTPPPPGGGPPTGGDSTVTLSSSTSFDTNRIFQRDVYFGDPTGYQTTYGKGWGTIPVKITPNKASASGLWVRMHDALDTDVVATTPGTGAVIQPITAVTGIASLTTGLNAIDVTVPAGLYRAYMDLAADAAFTHPIRIPIPFSMGSLFLLGPTTSHGSMWAGSYAYNYDAAGATTTVRPSVTQTVGIGKISPHGLLYVPNEAAWESAFVASTNIWLPPGDALVSAYPTSFAGEFLRLCIQRLGVPCAMVGATFHGGVTSGFNANDPSTTLGWGITLTGMAHADYKGDVHMTLLANNDFSTAIPSQVTARRLKSYVTGIRALNAAQPVPVNNPGAIVCSTPILSTEINSSSWNVYKRAARQSETQLQNVVNFDWFDAGFYLVSGHTSNLSRYLSARHWYRIVMGLMGTAKGGFALRRGPRVSNATRSGNTITVSIVHDGGTALRKVQWAEGNANTATSVTDSVASDVAAGCFFSVFPAGNTLYSGGRITVSSASIASANTITVVLGSTPANNVPLDLYYGADQNVIPSGGPAVFTDDTDDGDGLTRGRGLRATLDPIYVPPPTPDAQTITINTPASVAVGAWILLSGSGTGLSIVGVAAQFADSSFIEISVNGGTWLAPTSLRIKNDNRWSAFVQAPATAGTYTIAARRAGQTSADATTSVVVTTARNSLPASFRADATAWFDALNIGTLWQGTGKTLLSGDTLPVRCWADMLGTASNDLVQDYDTDAGRAPFYLQRKMSSAPGLATTVFAPYDDQTKDRPALYFENRQAADLFGRSLMIHAGSPLLSAIAGTCTIYIALEWQSTGSWFMSASTPVTGAKLYKLGNPNIAPTMSLSLATSGVTTINKMTLTRSGPNNVGATALTDAGVSAATNLTDFMVIRFNSTTGVMRFYQNKRNSEVTATVGAVGSVTFSEFILGGAFQIAGQPSFSEFQMHEFGVINRELTGDPVAGTLEIADLKTYATAKWAMS